MRDRREVDDRLRVDLAQHAREAVIVARVHHVDGDLGRAQQIDPLADDPEIQLLVRQLGHLGREREQVVVLHAVDDAHLGALGGQLEGQAVADKAAAADEDDPAAFERNVHGETSLIAWTKLSAMVSMSAESRCGPTGSAID